MEIGLWYHWNDVVLNVSGGGEHTHELEDNVDYLYYATITDDDIVEYLVPSFLREDEEQIYRRAIRHAINNLYSYIDYDNLANDEFFIDYLKDKYEEKAREAFEEENEAY